MSTSFAQAALRTSGSGCLVSSTRATSAEPTATWMWFRAASITRPRASL